MSAARKPGAIHSAESEKMQAIVVVNNFTTDMRPATFHTPRALLPIANTPVIDYVLSFLVDNGVERIIVAANTHAALIQKHLSSAKTPYGHSWLSCSAFEVVFVDVPLAESFGDVLREIHRQNIHPAHFFIVPCDIVTNMKSLRAVWNYHVARSNAVTLVTVEDSKSLADAHHLAVQDMPTEDGLPQSHVRTPMSAMSRLGSSISLDTPMMPTTMADAFSNAFATCSLANRFDPAPELDRITVELDSSAVIRKLIMWAEGTAASEDVIAVDQSLQLDLKAFSKPFTLRSDLLLTGIFACSAAVASIFRENFELDSMQDLARALLDHDLLSTMHTMAVMPAPRCYVSRLQSITSYLSMNEAVMQRRSFPLTRESNFSEQHAYYATHFMKPSVYIHTDSVKVHSTARIGPNVVLGEGTTVGPDTVIERSCIGTRVAIGSGCTIRNCVIMNDVMVENNTTIVGSVICSDVQVQRSASIASGCLLGSNVVIAAGVLLREDTRVAVDSSKQSEVVIVGPHGKGRSFTDFAIPTRVHTLDLFTSHDFESSEEDSEVEDTTEDDHFEEQVIMTVTRAGTENINADEIFTELSTTMLQCSSTDKVFSSIDTSRILLKYLVGSCAGKGSAAEIKKLIKASLKAWRGVLRKLLDTEAAMHQMLIGMCVGIHELGDTFHSQCHWPLSYLFDERVAGVIEYTNIKRFDAKLREGRLTTPCAAHIDIARTVWGLDEMVKYFNMLRDANN